MRIHVLVFTTLLTAHVAACSGDSESDGSGGSSGSAGSGAGGSAGSGLDASAGSAGSGGDGSAGIGGSGGAGGSGGSAGGSVDGGTDGATDGGSTNWDAYCADAAVQHASCGASLECTAAACVYSLYDPAVLDEYASCLLQRSCSELGSDDDCFGAAGKVNGQFPPAIQAKLDACTDRYLECAGSGAAFDPEDCTFLYPMILKQHSDAAEICLAKPCAEISGCVSAIATQFACLDA